MTAANFPRFLNVKADLLTFVKAIRSGALDRTDMGKDILPAAIGLDEAETLNHLTVPVAKKALDQSGSRSQYRKLHAGNY